MKMRMKTIKEAFGRVYGLPCWRVCYEPGLNLCMSFGDPSLSVREPPGSPESEAYEPNASRRIVAVSGEWWLWLNARWKFSMDGKRVATSSSSLKKRLAAVRCLDGQKLVEARVRRGTGSTKLTFDLGGVLDMRRHGPDDGRKLWLLYEPDGGVLTVRGDGTCSHECPPSADGGATKSGHVAEQNPASTPPSPS